MQVLDPALSTETHCNGILMQSAPDLRIFWTCTSVHALIESWLGLSIGEAAENAQIISKDAFTEVY